MADTLIYYKTAWCVCDSQAEFDGMVIQETGTLNCKGLVKMHKQKTQICTSRRFLQAIFDNPF